MVDLSTFSFQLFHFLITVNILKFRHELPELHITPAYPQMWRGPITLDFAIFEITSIYVHLGVYIPSSLEIRVQQGSLPVIKIV